MNSNTQTAKQARSLHVTSARGANPVLLLSFIFLIFSFLGVVLLVQRNLAPMPRSISNVMVGAYIVAVSVFTVWVLLGLGRTIRIALAMYAIGHLFWFAWPALKSLTGTTRWYGNRSYGVAITDSAVMATASLMLVFLSLTVAFYLLFDQWLCQRQIKKDDLTRSRHIPTLNKDEMLIVSALLLFLGLLPFMVYGQGITETVQGILGSRAAYKGWAQAAFEGNAIAVIGRASMVTIGALTLLVAIQSRRSISRLVSACVFVLVFAITYFDSGTRSWTILIAVPPLLVTVFLRIRAGAFNKRFAAFLIAFLILLVWLAQLQVRTRDSGFLLGRWVINSSTQILMIEDNDFFNETAIAMSAIPERTTYLHEPILLLFLTNPIPRSIWPNKPYSRVIREYSMIRDGYDIYVTQGISRMPSVVGQYVMSWGLLGLVQVSLLFGMFLAWVDSLWRSEDRSLLSLLWLATASAWIFVSFRGLVPGFHYPLIILGLIVLFEKSSSKSAQNKVRVAGKSTH